MKKEKIIWAIVAVVCIVAAVFLYQKLTAPIAPIVRADGTIDGTYSIAGVMTLGKPYSCKFEKSDATSKIEGVLLTDSKNIKGEFRIATLAGSSTEEFGSSLIIKDDVAYTWTSLAPIGYKSKVAKSATANASPSEQAQIVGMRDRLPYECEPWQSDQTVFEVPSWVAFSELK